MRAHLAPHARQRLATVLGSHWLARARRGTHALSAHAREPHFFGERRARAGQPPAYSLCLLSLAGQSKSAPLCMLHTIFMVSCGLKFFFLLSENAHICTFQLFFFPKERIRIYRFCDKERFINQFACYLNNVCF